MKHILFAFTLLLGFVTLAQKGEVNGLIKNKKGEGLGFATVTLLFPEDSTLAFFDITDGEGVFQIKDVVLGDYLLQAAFLGYGTTYREVSLSKEASVINLKPIILEDKSTDLGVVEVEGEAVPFLIKKDTVEYNSAAFRTKTNASVEDLLKKLPGVEVDKDGAIKAQGENVQRVLVDGKEFFSNDPKLATKNIPANAIKKVQVYDKKSEASEFTGIDDGEREKTINLLLKEDRKNGAFGEITGGYGTDDRYVASGKISRFTAKTQALALGNVNNINDYGLSIADFITFSGGPQALRSGGGGFRADGSVPISGQNQQGQLNSGLGALTYSYEFRKNNTLSGNYLFSKSNRDLRENSDFLQFTPNSQFSTKSNNTTTTDNENHGANLFWRNEIDSLTKLTMRANLSTANTREVSNGENRSLNADGDFSNQSINNSFDTGRRPSLSTNAQLVRKSASKKGRNLTLDASLNLNENRNTSDWGNDFTTLNPANNDTLTTNADQLWRTDNVGNGYSIRTRYNEPLGKNYYMEPDVKFEVDNLEYGRLDIDQLGELQDRENILSRDVQFLEPGINLKKNSSTGSLTIGVKQHIGVMQVGLDGTDANTQMDKKVNRVLPSISYRSKFGKSNFLRARLNSSVRYPSTNDLFPVANTQNLNFISVGNSNLEPEYVTNASFGMVFYDQFTFSSLNAFINGSYTENFISNSKTIGDNLAQFSQTINYKDAYNVSANVNYNRPIKKYGIVVDLRLTESYNRNFTLVNEEENILNSNIHSGRFSIGNKKKKNIDANVGVGLSITDSRYSLQENLNNTFTTTNYFGDIEWYISDSWTLSAALDYNIFDNQNFGEKQQVPLLTAEVSHNFLKGDKGTLKLSAFDLLNQYNGVNRIAFQNTVGETRSNVLGQYFLLSFTYKLNKIAAESNKNSSGMGR